MIQISSLETADLVEALNTGDLSEHQVLATIGVDKRATEVLTREERGRVIVWYGDVLRSTIFGRWHQVTGPCTQERTQCVGGGKEIIDPYGAEISDEDVAMIMCANCASDRADDI